MQLNDNTTEFLVLPVDPAAEDLRYRELETACREILAGLPSKDRQTLLAFHELLLRRQDREILTAYNSGIQTGIRRTKEKKII